MNMTINNFNDSTTTKAFSSFIEVFDMAPSILSKAKAIVGIQKEKFDKAERLIFERFLSHFISKNHKLLDQKTLIKMMELSSEHESVDYSITPMPIEHMEKLPTDYIEFH